MTTVFTLPIVNFERWDPNDPTMPKADGWLKGDYVFRLICEFSLDKPEEGRKNKPYIHFSSKIYIYLPSLYLVAVTVALAAPLILAAFQIKRLQRWWEEAYGAMQIRRMEARARGKKEGSG